MQKIKFYSLLGVFFLFLHFPSFSQAVNISQLSDQQLLQYMGMSTASGMSDDELVAKAKAKGLTDDQIQQLRTRIQGLNGGAKTAKAATADLSEDRTTVPVKKPGMAKQKTEGLPVFGSELFSNENLSFEPNLQIATPKNYAIGTGDQLNIDLFGYSDISYKLKVSPEGEIRIPNLGPLKVAGLNFDDARQKIKSQLAKIYPQITAGQTSVQLSLGQIRSIRVTLIGEVQKPGTYTLPSLATIANALYLAGGPNTIGSYRNIQLMRNGKLMTNFDLYDFLLRGDLTHNLRLEDDDIIKVNVYERRVSITGAVRRNAQYEVKKTDGLKDLVETAGGFTELAYKDLIRIVRIAATEKEIVNVSAAQFPSFGLNQGDSIHIDDIANKFSNKVNIDGAVFHPGAYALFQDASLKNFLEKAVLTENAYLKRGIINRKDATMQPLIIDFSVADIKSGKTNIQLQKNDSVHIYSINELKEEYTVSINGEVINPGSYPFVDSLDLQELILQAHGFKESASKKRIEISRRVREGSDTELPKYAVVDVIELNKNLDAASNLVHHVLQPFDIVAVRKDPSYKEQSSVTIEGQVLYPGVYTILNKQERLSDFVARAGGFRTDAYPKGAVLIRSQNQQENKSREQNRLKLLASSDSTKQQNKDSLINALNLLTATVGINLEEAVNHPGSVFDIYLEQGDSLIVPKELQTIKTTGGVFLPRQIVFTKDKSFMSYISESGGFAPLASRAKSFVTYANGTVSRTHHFLFIKSYPRIEPGAEVYVPLKRKNVSTVAEIASIATILTGFASIFLIMKSL